MIFENRDRNVFLGEQTDLENCHVSLRIGSDHLDPTLVSEELGLKPSRSWKRGVPFLVKPDKEVVRDFGSWVLDTNDLASKSLEAHAIHLLELVDGKTDRLRALIEAGKYRVSIVFWWSSGLTPGGYNLSSRTLGELCELCQDVEFHFL